MREGIARNHPAVVFGMLVVITLVIALDSLVLGRFYIPVDSVLGMLGNRVFSIPAAWTGQQETLFFNVRLPRVVMALAVGCSLAAAGAAFQGIFQNFGAT